MAVDLDFKRLGLGSALLADAMYRVTRCEIPACALMADAKDESALAFYRHPGFLALPTAAQTSFLPLATARV